MELLRRLLAALWKIWFSLIFITIFLILYPFFLVFLYAGNVRAVIFLKRIWGGLAINLAGIFVKRIWKTDPSHIPETCVLIANHSSYLDIIATCLVYPHVLIYMGKAELLKVPLFNIFFKKLDIPVNRKSTTAAHHAYQRSVEEIERGRTMCIFPEGTISDEGALKPFKNGAFKLAIEKQVPVVVITFIDNWKMLQNGGFFKSFGRPGLIKAVIHPPIETKGMAAENLVSLRDQVFELTVKTLEEYKK